MSNSLLSSRSATNDSIHSLKRFNSWSLRDPGKGLKTVMLLMSDNGESAGRRLGVATRMIAVIHQAIPRHVQITKTQSQLMILGIP